jgi:hypothetical protein
MKRTMFLSLIVVVSIAFMSLAIAQDRTTTMKETEKTGMMNKQGMMGQGEHMMGQGESWGPHEMCGMMMGSMMEHCMVPTGDGGVIVMMGDKLMKYDRDLNLVKEMQVAIDMDHMSDMMSRMMAMCTKQGNTMQGQMMKGGMMQGGMMQQGTMQKEGTNTKK